MTDPPGIQSNRGFTPYSR